MRKQMNPDERIPADFAAQIAQWGQELGFQQVGIADIALDDAEQKLNDWLSRGFHGEMHYMERHGSRRSRPAELVPDTCSVISVRMDYLPATAAHPEQILAAKDRAYIARYALGRDYHKIIRRRLQKLADRIATVIGPFGYRVFVDSAPVLEKPIAQRAGLGWLGKHTNIINKDAGSWFLLGEIFLDLALQPSLPVSNHCGTCQACIDICPTQAIIAPYQLDARRCISYLTIELRGSIPLEFRTAIGNRIFGCDDCQLICPWNKFAVPTREADFQPRHNLDTAGLVELFAWTQAEWEARVAGSPLRRPGYAGWLRNLAVALGNAPHAPKVIAALNARRDDANAMVREHVTWALEQQSVKSA